MLDVSVAVALDSQGDDVKALVMDSGHTWLEDLDWSRVHPYWLLASIGGQPVGCIQALVGYPMGRAEFLCVARSLGHRQRMRVVRALVLSAMAALRRSGCQMTIAIVGAPYEEWVRHMVKRGACVILSGDLVAKRLI